MSSVLGVSAAGIGTGGTVALLQAAAATGAPLAPVLAPVVLPVLAVGVAGVAGVAVAGVAVAHRVNEGRTLPKGRTGGPTPAAGSLGASSIFFLDFSDDPWAEASSLLDACL